MRLRRSRCSHSGSAGGIKIKGIPAGPAPFADATHSVFMLILYASVFTAISAWLSRTRDVTA